MRDPLAAMAPLADYTVTPHGAYGVARVTSADGACGVGAHPCRHWGLDMRPAVRRAWVVAPERAVVRYVDRDASASAAPLGGYGPGSLLLEGWHAAHVLGHLDPASIPATLAPGVVVEAGDQLGRVDAGPNHLHWEVRRVLLPPRGAARGELTWSPLHWLAARQLAAGAVAGVAAVLLPAALMLGVALVGGAVAVTGARDA